MRFCPAVPALGLVLGATLGLVTPLEPAPLWTMLTAAWVALAGAILLRRDRWALAAAIVGFAGAAALLAHHANRSVRAPPLRAWFDVHADPETGRIDLAWLEGPILADAGVTEYGAAFTVDVRRITLGRRATDVRGGVRVGVGGSAAEARADDWRAGRWVRLSGGLRRPAPYRNPGVTDQELTLARRGIVLLASVKSAALVNIVGPGSWSEELAGRARARVRAALRATIARWSPQSAAIVAAITIGDRASLDPTIVRRLQEAGTYHVIAISGGNLAILSGIAFAVLRRVGLGPRLFSWLTLALVLAYGRIVEGGASVARAVEMAGTYLFARGLDHRTSPINALLISLGLAVAADPLVLYDAGFFLTFGATIALLSAVPWALNRIAARHPFSQPPADDDVTGPGWPARPWHLRWLLIVIGLVVATAGIEVVLAPVGAWFFSRVSLAGLLANIVAVPAMSAVQVLGLVTVLLEPVSHRLADATAAGAHAAVWLLLSSGDIVLAAPWLTWRVPPPPAVLLALYYASLLALVRVRQVPGRAALNLVAGLVALTTLSPMAARAQRWLPRNEIGSDRWVAFAKRTDVLRVTFLDVAQGDATLVATPGGRVWLVDAGGSLSRTFDVGERILAPALWHRRLVRLDALLVSHGDPDHVGGAGAVLRDFVPGEVVEGVPVPSHRPLALLRETATRLRLPWRNVFSPTMWEENGVRVTIVHPPPPDWLRPRVRNDDSLVVDLHLGEVHVLLTGDIGSDAERGLLQEWRPSGLVVLKVPHHGSGGSSSVALLDALRPAVAVVSCGRGNSYGHPARAVRERYASIGTRFLRTDRDGAVDVVTDGRVVGVRTIDGDETWMTAGGGRSPR